MKGEPGAKSVPCPECGEMALAIVPKRSEIVGPEADTDGKVWVNCHECAERFLVYFRTT